MSLRDFSNRQHFVLYTGCMRVAFPLPAGCPRYEGFCPSAMVQGCISVLVTTTLLLILVDQKYSQFSTADCRNLATEKSDLQNHS